MGGGGGGGRVGSGRAVVLSNFQFRGALLIWITEGQGPTLLAVGAGRLDIFFSTIISLFFLNLSRIRLDIDQNIVSNGR